MTAGSGRETLTVAALTATGAFTDGVSYLGLGHVFPANMTGNTVLLGLGAAVHDGHALRGSATALGAYVLAAGALGAAVRESPRRWQLRAVFLAELCLLLAAAAWWVTLTGRPAAGAPRYGLIALVGAAMGTQSALTARLSVPGVSTTYITGTWTALSMSIGGRLRRWPADGEPHRRTRQGLVVVLYPAAAFAAGAAYTWWHAAAAFLPVPAVALAAAVQQTRRADPRPAHR